MQYIEFAPGEKYADTSGEINRSHNPIDFTDCGRLINKDEVVVDIDNIHKDKIKKILETLNIKTLTVETERGYHLIFKLPKYTQKNKLGTRGVTALGFDVEYKLRKNNYSATTFRRNGITRTTINSDTITVLPDVFMPLVNAVNFATLSETDGWYLALLKHRSALNIGRIERVNEIVQLVNDVVFDVPLIQKRVDAILDAPLGGTKHSAEKPYEMATHIIKTYKVNQFIGHLYFKKDKIFETGVDKLRLIIMSEFDDLVTFQVDEIIKQCHYRCPNFNNDYNFPIILKNGFLKNAEFTKLPYTEFSPYMIDLDYEPDCEPVIEVDNYLNHLTNGDADYRKVLMEIFGHMLITDIEVKRALAKFFIFVGSGGNGKGTLLNVVRELLGRSNCAANSINQLADPRYQSTLKGKLVCLGDDIDNQSINNEQMKMLKNISSCDYISSREIYKQGEESIYISTLIFTSNHILKSFEKGVSYKRRVLWCPMFGKIEKIDGKFITKLTTEKARTYFLKLIIEGHIRLCKELEFTDSEIIKDFTTQYHLENNNASIFIKDVLENDVKNVDGKKPTELYDEYTAWLTETDYGEISKKLFKETIMTHFNLEIKNIRSNGKTKYAYAVIGGDNK